MEPKPLFEVTPGGKYWLTPDDLCRRAAVLLADDHPKEWELREATRAFRVAQQRSLGAPSGADGELAKKMEERWMSLLLLYLDLVDEGDVKIIVLGPWDKRIDSDKPVPRLADL